MERDVYIPSPPPADADQDTKLNYVVDRLWRMEVRQVEDHGDLKRLKKDVADLEDVKARITRAEVLLSLWVLLVTAAMPFITAKILEWWSS